MRLTGPSGSPTTFQNQATVLVGLALLALLTAFAVFQAAQPIHDEDNVDHLLAKRDINVNAHANLDRRQLQGLPGLPAAVFDDTRIISVITQVLGHIPTIAAPLPTIAANPSLLPVTTIDVPGMVPTLVSVVGGVATTVLAPVLSTVLAPVLSNTGLPGVPNPAPSASPVPPASPIITGESILQGVSTILPPTVSTGLGGFTAPQLPGDSTDIATSLASTAAAAPQTTAGSASTPPNLPGGQQPIPTTPPVQSQPPPQSPAPGMSTLVQRPQTANMLYSQPALKPSPKQPRWYWY